MILILLISVAAGKTQIIQNGLCYTDKSGKVKCGCIHEDGAEDMRQTCEIAIFGDEYWHHINPYRTLKERQLLTEFDLDHK